MTREEFAKRLDGSAYPFELAPPDSIIAKQEGFVVVYGTSDDLVECEGCYEEEAGCFDGGIVSFDRNGTSDDGEDHANLLEVYWCGKCHNKAITTDAAWEYRADFPVSTFKIYDDDELYCHGLVVDVRDLHNIAKI